MYQVHVTNWACWMVCIPYPELRSTVLRTYDDSAILDLALTNTVSGPEYSLVHTYSTCGKVLTSPYRLDLSLLWTEYLVLQNP